MTSQLFENLYYNGQEYNIATEPLSPYLQELEEPPKLGLLGSHCWRGYVGTWEIRDNKLFLIALRGWDEDDNEIGLDFIFPDQGEIFAEWYSGELRIPIGEMLRYKHIGYASVYEKDLFIKFDRGLLIETREVDNSLIPN